MLTRNIKSSLDFVRSADFHEGLTIRREVDSELECITLNDDVAAALRRHTDARFGHPTDENTLTAYWDTLGELDHVLSAYVVECVEDALAMVGVTDPERVRYIAGTVICGGEGLPWLNNIKEMAKETTMAQTEQAKTEPSVKTEASVKKEPLVEKDQYHICSNAAYAGTPGAGYVDTYLVDTDEYDLDAYWLAEGINGGAITVCPRCHFVRHPDPAMGMRGHFPCGENPAQSDCDVCALLPRISRRLLTDFVVTEGFLTGADASLAAERTRRASAVFMLWMGAHGGAEALCWDAMARSLGEFRAVAAETGG